MYCYYRQHKLVCNKTLTKSMNFVINGDFRLVQIKVMVFSKNSKISANHFKFSVGQTNLEIVSGCKYLRVNTIETVNF